MYSVHTTHKFLILVPFAYTYVLFLLHHLYKYRYKGLGEIADHFRWVYFPIKSTYVRCFALSFVDNNIPTTLEIVAK